MCQQFRQMPRLITVLCSTALARALLLLAVLSPAFAEDVLKPGAPGPAPSPAAGVATVTIGYLVQEVKRPLPVSRLNIPPQDLGVAGAEIALKDNNTTGRFTKQQFTLEVERVSAGGDAVAALEKLVASGHRFILVDAPAKTVLQLADSARGRDVLLFNISAPDVNLRQEDCRANVLHVAPDRAMLADALAQYLVWKKWTRWFVVKGVLPEDLDYLAAIERSATRFGGKIVEEREYKGTLEARRTDSGQQQIQQQMPALTQGAPDYDVLIVADENEVFGPYLPYRSWDPRPVAGTAGLEAMSWHPAHEQWGASQMQNRFQRFANRFMLPLDYQAWVAVRAIGEGVTRTGSANLDPVATYIRSDAFDLAAFKGQKVTFRSWDGQLRQPIIIAGSDLPVSMSPQEGFLHEHAEVDTLGIDQPESKCKLQ